MADEDRTFDPNAVQANRAQRQGLGVGQKELNAQRGADRNADATDPGRTQPFGESLDPTNHADQPDQADLAGEPGVQASSRTPGAALDDRNAAGRETGPGDLGASTPAGVDIHDLGQDDNPEQEWGEAADEGAVFASNHSRRPVRTEAERGQGAKTRQLNKDIVSRRT